MTHGLLVSRTSKLNLLKLTAVFPSPENVQKLKLYRNIYDSLIRKSKKMYFEKTFLENKKNPKKLWWLIKNTTTGTNNQNKIKEILIDNKTITDSGEMAETFNNYFTNIGTNISSAVPETNVNPLDYIPDENIPDFDIGNTGQIHFLDILKAFESKTSPDFDQISIKWLKFVGHEISIPIAHIFSLSMNKGVFPDKFKTSRTVPIFKQGDPQQCDNYRPISLINTFSKILEKWLPFA